MAFGVCTNCSSSFPASTGQKWKFLQSIFFDIVTTHNDEICYVKHVLDPLCVLFTPFGCGGWGRVSKGLGHNLLMQFSSLGSQMWRANWALCGSCALRHGSCAAPPTGSRSLGGLGSIAAAFADKLAPVAEGTLWLKKPPGAGRVAALY